MIGSGEGRFGIKVGERGWWKFAAGRQYSSALYIVLFYGLIQPDIMDDVCYDKNQTCSGSTNFCGFSTFSFAFTSFVVTGR